MLPPAMFTGTLALTAVWFASADDSAPWVVVSSSLFRCCSPAPQQPPRHRVLRAVCDWLLFWVVLALLLALLSASFSRFWLAALLPPVMLPPAMFTGTLA